MELLALSTLCASRGNFFLIAVLQWIRGNNRHQLRQIVHQGTLEWIYFWLSVLAARLQESAQAFGPKSQRMWRQQPADTRVIGDSGGLTTAHACPDITNTLLHTQLTILYLRRHSCERTQVRKADALHDGTTRPHKRRSATAQRPGKQETACSDWFPLGRGD